MAIHFPRVLRASKTIGREPIQRPVMSPLMKLSLGVLLVSALFLLLTGMVMTIGRWVYPSGYMNPFLEFADLVIGQPAELLAAYPCQFDNRLPEVPNYACDFYPDAGRFQRVSVSFYDTRIMGVTLSGAFRLGELVHYWGPPDAIRHYATTYVLQWDEGVLAYTMTGQRRFSNQLAVKAVTLIAPMQDDDWADLAKVGFIAR